MKRISALIAIVLLTLHAPAANARTDWTTLVKVLKDSVVLLEADDGLCSGFVINKEQNYVLTAAHCDGASLYAHQRPVVRVYKDRKFDLMILQVDGLRKPALPIASDNPKVGDEVASYGYGMGLDNPILRVSRISEVAVMIEQGGPFIMVDGAFLAGQSGGPVMNKLGEVVMIVQLRGNSVGLGRGAEDFRGRIKDYLPKVVKP